MHFSTLIEYPNSHPETLFWDNIALLGRRGSGLT